jgi:hypothetical protein
MPCSIVMEAFIQIVLSDKLCFLETGQPYHQRNIHSCRKHCAKFATITEFKEIGQSQWHCSCKAAILLVRAVVWCLLAAAFIWRNLHLTHTEATDWVMTNKLRNKRKPPHYWYVTVQMKFIRKQLLWLCAVLVVKAVEARVSIVSLGEGIWWVMDSCKQKRLQVTYDHFHAVSCTSRRAALRLLQIKHIRCNSWGAWVD